MVLLKINFLEKVIFFTIKYIIILFNNDKDYKLFSKEPTIVKLLYKTYCILDYI